MELDEMKSQQKQHQGPKDTREKEALPSLSLSTSPHLLFLLCPIANCLSLQLIKTSSF
jgi:hypothetical protein